MVPDSMAFDRAAATYDRTRAIPRTAVDEVVARIGGEIGRRRCLEVGVGTGRIALPLHRAGLRMVGVDLSTGMLAQLVANAGGTRPFPLVVADATRLPFRDRSFGGVLAVHVLHLIPAWRAVLDEVVRLAAGGVLIVGITDLGEIVREIIASFVDRLDRTGRRHPGMTDITDLDEAMADRDAVGRSPAPISVSRTATIERVIAAIKQQRWSWTWRYDAEELHDVAGEVRRWASREIGDLGTEVETYAAMRLRVYDLPPG